MADRPAHEVEEHQLGDGPGDEEVDDPVARVRRHQVLVLADGVDGLGAAGVAGGDLTADQGVEGRAQPDRSGCVPRGRLMGPPSPGLRQLAHRHVVEQRVEHRADLAVGQGPVAEAEEGQGEQ